MWDDEGGVKLKPLDTYKQADIVHGMFFMQMSMSARLGATLALFPTQFVKTLPEVIHVCVTKGMSFKTTCAKVIFVLYQM